MSTPAPAREGMPTGASSLEGARRRIPGNVAFNLAGFAISIGLSVFITSRLVHGLGEVGYGIWALIGHIAGNMSLFDFGMQITVTRYLARHHALDEREKMHQVISTALMFSLLPALLVLGVGAVVAVFAPGLFHLPAAYISVARTSIMLVAIGVACIFPGGVLNSCIPALSRYDLLNLRNIVCGVLQTGLLWWVLDHGHGLIAVAAVCTLVQGFGLALGTVLSFRLMPWLRLSWRYCTLPMLRALCGFSFWAFLLSIANKLIFTFDNVVVAMVLGPAAVAFYGIGGSIADSLRGGLFTVTMIYAPLASQMHALSGHAALGRLLRRGTRVAMLLAMPGVIALILVGAPFLRFWLGADYATRTTGILILLSLSVCAYAIALTCRQVLYGMNRHRISAWISLGEAAANLGLSVYLAMRLGAIGVAWGTLIPAVLGEAVILPAFTCRLLAVPLAVYYRDVLGRPLLASVPYLLWVNRMRSHHVVQGWLSLTFWLLPGLALYSLASWLVALEPDERAAGLAFLRRGWRQLAGAAKIADAVAGVGPR